MAATGIETVISLPRIIQRPWGVLTQVARNLTWDPRMGFGVEFQTTPLHELSIVAADCITNYSKAASGFNEVETQPAFYVYDGFECSALSGVADEMRSMSDERVDVLLSDRIAEELMTGAASGGHGLQASATVLSDAAGVVAGVAALENWIGENGNGAQGTIHMTPATLTWAVHHGVVNLRSGVYYTPGGHLVSADSGYIGNMKPDDGNAAAAGSEYIYATGPVFWSRSPITEFSETSSDRDFDFTRDVERVLREMLGIVVFDPDTVGAIETVLT